jgi:hypothetical protein
MALVDLPMTLGAAQWDKQKAALAKAAKPPATKLPDELKTLTKLHLGLDWAAFGADKLKTADDAKSTLADLEAAVKGKIKTLLSQVEAVETAATSFEKEAKKDKAFPKEPLTAITAILKSTKEYTADVEAAIESARKALTDKAKALASAAPPAATAKQIGMVKSRLLTAIKAVRKPPPNAKPTRFMIVQGKTTTGLALARAVGPAQEKLLKAVMPGQAPYKILREAKAEVIWEANALTFVSDKLSSSVVKKVQLWIKTLLKLNLKLRVRKSNGEVIETEGENIPENLLQAEPTTGGDAAQDRTDFMARLAELQPGIKTGLTGANAAAIKELMASITALTKANDYDAADAELDEIEALLAGDSEDEGDELDDEEATTDAPQAKAKAPVSQGDFTSRLTALQPGIKTGLAGAAQARIKKLVASVTALGKAGKFGDADAALDEIEQLLKPGGGKDPAKAMEEWKTRRAAAVTSLKSVATKVAGAKHASSAKAIIELQAVIKNLTAEPSTLQQVTELQRWLTDDDVVNDVCELAEDIRTPLLGALTQLRSAIAA